MANAAPWAHPIWRQPTEATKTTKPHSCGVQHRVPVKLQESFGAQSLQPGNCRPTIFTCPKYFWAKTSAISLFDPRSIPEAFHFRCKAPVISLNQARAVGRGSCIASTTLASPRPSCQATSSHDASWIGCKECPKDHGWKGINPTRINKKVRLQRGLGMEHSSCSTRCTRWQLSQVGRPWHHIWGSTAISVYSSTLPLSFLVKQEVNWFLCQLVCVTPIDQSRHKHVSVPSPKVMMQKPGIESLPKCLCRPLYCITQ